MKTKKFSSFFKTHTLRWVFYRRIPNFTIDTIREDKYKSPKRCSNCKTGTNLRIGFLFTNKNGAQEHYVYCPHCGEQYVEEPNTNISHKLYKITNTISKTFWVILDKLHIV